MAQVNEPEFGGVNVNHPTIVSGIKNLHRQGFRTEEIIKRIGMPAEVVQKYQREAERESKR